MATSALMSVSQLCRVVGFPDARDVFRPHIDEDFEEEPRFIEHVLNSSCHSVKSSAHEVNPDKDALEKLALLVHTNSIRAANTLVLKRELVETVCRRPEQKHA